MPRSKAATAGPSFTPLMIWMSTSKLYRFKYNLRYLQSSAYSVPSQRPFCKVPTKACCSISRVPFALVARRFLLGAQGKLTGDVTTEPTQTTKRLLSALLRHKRQARLLAP